MAITQVNYPVTGSVGTYRNIFPSQRALNIDFLRRDGLISTISSGTDGNTRLELSAAYDVDLAVGDYVTWFSDAYTLRTNRVTELVDASTFDVDNPFNSTVATNGFVNYRKQWFLEARFVAKDTPTDEQDAVLAIDDYSQIPSARDGSLSLDCSLPGDLLTPDFEVETGLATGLFTEFKVQFRESYSTDRAKTWVSPTPDVPIMLVLGTQTMPFNDFTDTTVLQKRFIWSYPYLFTYVYSMINDNADNVVTFNLLQYDISKNLIDTQAGYNVATDLNGVYLVRFTADEGDNILDECAFIEITALVTSSAGQYDPTQYDPTQYA